MGPEAIVESENLRLVYFFVSTVVRNYRDWKCGGGMCSMRGGRRMLKASIKSANAFLVDFLDKKNAKELELEVNACSEFERHSGVGDQDSSQLWVYGSLSRCSVIRSSQRNFELFF